MSNISVNFDSLAAGQQGVQANYAKLNGTLEQLNSELQPMITTWTGAAQESYLQCKKQWDDAAAALAQVLNQIGQAVGQAHENYTSAENAARGNWA